MNKKRKIDVKLKNSHIDVTGHKKGDVYYRISPSNWSKLHPMHWISLIFGWEPVWVVDRTIDEFGNPLCYGVAKEYEHRLSNLKTVSDLTDFIDKLEEPFLSHATRGGRK